MEDQTPHKHTNDTLARSPTLAWNRFNWQFVVRDQNTFVAFEHKVLVAFLCCALNVHLACTLGGLARPFARPSGPAGNVRKSVEDYQNR